MASISADSLVPLANLSPHVDSGACRGWVAQDDDPQFLVDLGGEVLAGGWYLLDAVFRCHAGVFKRPCFYPDYGSGMAELERIDLPEPDSRGRLRAVVRLKAGTVALRFDPSVAVVAFDIAAFRLRRLSRPAALAHMLAARGADAMGGRGRILAAFLGPALRGEVRRGGEEAYRLYSRGHSHRTDGYHAWLAAYDRAPVQRPPAAPAHGTQPLFSIILPVYQTPEKWLRRCIESVFAQSCPEWELCIADDASTLPHVRRVLEEYACRDPRVRVVHRERNGHISLASNSAVELARGSFLALLDHDDELAPVALMEMRRALEANPRWRIAYSDEDKIDEQGRRFDPYFKPEFNHELLLGQNTICHLAVLDAALVREVGGFRAGLEGAQDWDLVLRCIERLRDDQVGHVPRVLYHWRAISGSTALGTGEKNYAAEAGRRAVAEHIERSGWPARAELNLDGHVTVHRSVPAPAPRVSLVIPTRDRAELLRMSVGSILEKTDYPDYEILVVDNQSIEPETLEYFRTIQADPRVRVLRYDAPFNYSAVNNFAVRHATGAVVGLINNDIEVIEGSWLRAMVAQAVRPDVGAVGALLLYPDGTIQHAGVVLGIGGVAGHVYVGQPRDTRGHFGRACLAQEMSAVTAACLLVRREVFEAVGGLDEGLAVAFNDIDFCLRIREAGWKNIWTPLAVLYHHESASRGYEDTPEKVARFRGETEFMRARWGVRLESDPTYNPNLTLEGTPFDLAFPPRLARAVAVTP